MDTDDKQIQKVVKDWYAKNARTEWRRLGRGPYHQIEFMATMHFVEEYLPKHGLVLDAGGGPGRYTIELARRGSDAALLDLVPELLKAAKRQIKRAGVQKRVKQTIEGSIDDLSMFADESFDAVLCLGAPLGHILDAGKRDRAVEELLRVSKKGAPILVSVISRMGLLRTILVRFPHEMKYVKHHWTIGGYVPGLQGEGFTTTHWFLPEELQTLFEKHGGQVLTMAGLEGLSSHHEKETNQLFKDQEKWKMWTEILRARSIVGSAEHFLLVGRKRG